jgi:predicted DNA binding CopG/RHH family protein
LKKLKKIPKFRSEDAERRFWARHSPLDFYGVKEARLAIFPNLKPTNRTISIRLPESLVEAIKLLANKQDIPYQSMLKILLAEKVREALNLQSRKGKAA